MNLFENNGAEFSEDRKYRYALHRIWDANLPLVAFVGLNPSTANETSDDPTIRRVKAFAKGWGYGGFYMLNLFAFVTPYPDELKKCENPIGDNDEWLQKVGGKCERIIFAYGNFDVFGRDKEVAKMFTDVYCLGRNKNGSPKHPLYLSGSTQMEKF